MEQFNLFDRVQLIEPVALTGDFSNALANQDKAASGTLGTIVEVLEPGRVFLVELFGHWVRLKDTEGLHQASAEEKGAFRETLGVEVMRVDQMALLNLITDQEHVYVSS